MWPSKPNGHHTVQKLATRFGGSPSAQSVSLDYPYSLTIQYHRTRLTVAVSQNGEKVYVVIPDFRWRRHAAFSFGTAYPGFSLPVKENVLDGLPDVYTSEALGNHGLACIQEFLSRRSNVDNLLAIELAEVERLAIFSNQIEAWLDLDGLDDLAFRLDCLCSIFHTNTGPSECTSTYEQCAGHWLIVGQRLEEDHYGSSASPIHVIGDPEIAAAPRCRNCLQPMHVLAVIDLQDASLSLPAFLPNRLPVIACLNCDSYAAPVFLNHSTDNPSVVRQERGQSFGGFPETVAPRILSTVAIAEGEQQPPAGGPRHKLCGKPDWIQSELVPDCCYCGKPMTFIVQLASDSSVGLEFGDNGILYTYYCGECKTAASFAQWY